MPECLLGILDDPAMLEQALVEKAFDKRQHASAKAAGAPAICFGQTGPDSEKLHGAWNLLMRNQTSWEMPVKVDAYQQDRE